MKKFLQPICLILLAAMMLPLFSSCAPELVEVEGRFRELIEQSAEINTILFGEGLPHAGADVEYVDDGSADAYDAEFYYAFVLDDCGYKSIKDIKAAAEEIYTAEYLSGIYPLVFEGYYDESTYDVIRARYIEKDDALMFNTATKIHDIGREYHYDTMKIVKPSSKNFITVEIETVGMYLDTETLEYKEGTSVIRLAFARDMGVWRLDSPTY